MISMTHLLWAVWLEGLLLVAILLLFFGHGAWLWWSRQQDQPRWTRACDLITSGLDGDGLSHASRDWLRRLPLRLQIRLCIDLLPNLGGAQRQQLIQLFQDIGFFRQDRTSLPEQVVVAPSPERAPAHPAGRRHRRGARTL